jgi:hypothetical protein
MTGTFLAEDVFVAGYFPRLTYNARLSTDLQRSLTKYIKSGRGECLAVHGPSKAGKTVLVEKALPPDLAVWIRGDDIQSIDDLYRQIIDQLDLFTSVEVSTSSAEELTVDAGVEVSVIPGMLKFRSGAAPTISSENTRTKRRDKSVSYVAKSELDRKPVPIVIDDFHFIPDHLRVVVAQAIKDLIRRTHVILIAIPHEAFDIVRAQRDMDFRVIGLPVDPWEHDELLEIAREGFELLGVVDTGDAIGNQLATACMGAPFIMQALCLGYVTDVMNLEKTAIPAVDALAPKSWETFFGDIATNRQPASFGALIKGKDSRGQDRIERRFIDGRVTDIYGAILYAVARSGPVQSISAQDLGRTMATFLVDPPKPYSFGATLRHLAEIAEAQRGNGDKPLDYRNGTLEIVDPFLSFYLRYADWKLPAPPSVAEPLTEE